MRYRWLLIFSALFCFGIGAFTYFPQTESSFSSTKASTKVFSASEVSNVAKIVSNDDQVSQSVTQLLDQVKSGTGENECAYVKAGDRDVLTLNADQSLVPASSIKLLTAYAALEKLGNNKKFVTQVKGKLKAEGNVSPIYLVGGGDPYLTTQSFRTKSDRDKELLTQAEKLVTQLKGKGITQVNGDLVVDDSIFDDKRTVDAWQGKYQARTVAPIGGLLINHNIGEDGAVSPADPGLFAGEAFKALLIQSGIPVTGNVIRGSVPDDIPTLASVSSKDMSVVVAKMLRNSDNTGAEMITKYLGVKDGVPATTKSGLVVIHNTIKTKWKPVGYVQNDGSGLAINDKTSCSLLVHAYSGLPTSVQNNLSVAGESGTLATRLKNTPAAKKLIAKTGTLNNVSSLTGTVKVNNDIVYTFAVIANGLHDDTQARNWQDAMAIAVSSPAP